MEDRMSKYSLGVDFGTLSGRAVLIDIDTGAEMATSVLEYEHGVMSESFVDGSALPADYALQHPQDYLDHEKMREHIDYKSLPEEPYKPLATVARKAAADGIVLLKNEGRILPLGKNDCVSLFGRTQIDYNKSGTGSGGLVNVDRVVNILDGIRENGNLTLNGELVSVYEEWLKDHPFDKGAGWAQEPWCQEEMVPSDEVVSKARQASDVAVVIIGRAAGEDKDNGANKGSWYLTDDEEALLAVVTKHFDKTVVLLNVGNIIDMSWVEKYGIGAVAYIWQGGQDGGAAVADMLSGNVNPSGRLTDTIAKDIFLYPSVKNFGNIECNLYEEDIYVGYRYFETFRKDDVLYPFGFGLSYTDFEQTVAKAELCGETVKVSVRVKNVGKRAGREVVQVYFEAPQGKLGKSLRSLIAFGKTELISSGEEQTLDFEINIAEMASYDDGGVTGNKSSYVLEAGEYKLYVGKNVREAAPAFSFTLKELKVTERLSEALAPVRDLDIIYPEITPDGVKIAHRRASKRTVDYCDRIMAETPKKIKQTGDRGIKLADVKDGKATMEEFVAQLSSDQLIHLSLGEGMCSPKVRPGGAGAVGGVTEELAHFGIPIAALHDGPSGIRMDNGDKATSLPNGTAIACTWDVELAEEIYELLSIELTTHSIDSILGPGINIHRVPLNGRNFEYFSEDPYITGKFAAAMIRGVAKYGNSATVKHFAANSQEYHRRDNDAVMSERAAREIYLKGFEYAVKEGKPRSLMTSYNLINGIWSANNYELNTTVLRGEWGYSGFVVTDWWPRLSFESTDGMPLRYMVEAQNDVYMPTSDAKTFNHDLYAALEEGEITLGQLQRNAMNILRYLASSHALERFEGSKSEGAESLADKADQLGTVYELTFPECEREYIVELGEVGVGLLCIEYSSAAPDISQMTVNVSVDGVNAVSLTVNGTNGEKKTIRREIATVSKRFTVSFKYPADLLRIARVEIRK